MKAVIIIITVCYLYVLTSNAIVGNLHLNLRMYVGIGGHLAEHQDRQQGLMVDLLTCDLGLARIIGQQESSNLNLVMEVWLVNYQCPYILALYLMLCILQIVEQ